MIKRTFKDVKAELAKGCARSGVPGTDSRVMEYLNEATEELMTGEYAGVVDRYSIRTYHHMLVLPGNLDSILNLTVDNAHYELKAPWFELDSWGPGPQTNANNASGYNCIDRGETCSYREIPNEAGKTYKIRVYVEGDESDGTITLQGYDSEGKWIRSAFGGAIQDGETLQLPNGSSAFFVETFSTFSYLESVIKSRTGRTLYVKAWDGTTETDIAQYAPQETNPSYRRYFIQGINDDDDVPSTVIARCLKRFVPVVADNDPLIISNLPALKLAVRAVTLREQNQYEEARSLMNEAHIMLQRETKAYRGNATRPAITFNRSFGIGNLPNIR